MRIEIRRDESGRPVAIVLRTGGPDAPEPTGFRERLRKSGVWKPFRWIARVARAPVETLRHAVPTVAFERGDEETLTRLRVRVGSARDPGPSRLVGRLRGACSSLATLVRNALRGLAAGVPTVVVRRDAAGTPEAISILARAAATHVQHLKPGSAAAPGTSAEEWSIEPLGHGWSWRMRELWRYRYLFPYFAIRMMTGMFRNTKLRPLWLTLRVAGPIGMGAAVFGGVLNVASDGLPYFLFYLGGHTTWAVFESGVMFTTRVLERNKSLITKVYFPRLILPITGLAPALLELAVLSVTMVCTLSYYAVVQKHWYARSDLGLVAAAVAVVMALFLALGVGLWTSVMQARYRDVRYTLRYVMRFWLYFTPVIYPLSQIPEKWRWLAYLNPMTPVVEIFKWGLLGIGQPSARGLAFGGCLLVATFISGLWYFTATESASVDKI